MFSKGWTRKAFGQRIGHILRTCAFQQLDVAIAYELPQIMQSSVDMPSALPISGIFAHQNTRGIILPYLCVADLPKIETPQLLFCASRISGVYLR
jgi:hypothetical protein